MSASTAVAVSNPTSTTDNNNDDQECMDPALIRKNLSNLGKTFNNARHAYLSLDIS